MIGVTGASGFVGQRICQQLAAQGHSVVALSRKPPSAGPGVEWRRVGDLEGHTDWPGALHGVRCVVHTAARVHQLDATANQPSAYTKVNVEGTRRLAIAAGQAGVRRFVFLSSVKAVGEQTEPGHPFRHDTPAAPLDDYGRSKLTAELELRSLSARQGMELVVIRPPLVYGPGVKANFRQLVCWVARGYPLPLGSIRNRRALVGLDNLVDLVARCTDDPRAAGQTFMVSDGSDLSTPELIRAISRSLGREPRLWPVPPAMLRWLAWITHRTQQWQRLSSSLEVDIAHTCQTLDWSPPVPAELELERTAASIVCADHEKTA